VVEHLRWYDRNPTVSEAMRVWESLPRSIQVLVAQEVSTRIHDQISKNYQVRPTLQNTRASNARLMGLYQTGAKRRWYDQDPVLRRTVNSLALVGDNELLAVAECIRQVGAFLKEQTRGRDDLTEDILAAMLSDVIHRIIHPTQSAGK
jgi:hypothetical protein